MSIDKEKGTGIKDQSDIFNKSYFKQKIAIFLKSAQQYAVIKEHPCNQKWTICIMVLIAGIVTMNFF